MQRGVGDTYAQDPGIEPFAAEPMLSRTPAVAISLANSHGSRRPGSRNSPGRGNRTFCTRRPSCRCMIRNCSNHRRRRRTRYLSTCSRDRRTCPSKRPTSWGRSRTGSPSGPASARPASAQREQHERRLADPGVRDVWPRDNCGRPHRRFEDHWWFGVRVLGLQRPEHVEQRPLGQRLEARQRQLEPLGLGVRRPRVRPRLPPRRGGRRSELSPLAARGSVPKSCAPGNPACS